MRNKTICLLLAGILLSGCSKSPQTGPAPSPTLLPAAPAETAEPATVSAAPSEQPTLHLSETSYSWDAMQPVGIWGNTPMRVEAGYYTVCRDGLWGLITADGRQLLDCVNERPIDICDKDEWICEALQTYTNEDHPDAIALQQATGRPLCLPHGVLHGWYYYDTVAQEVRRYSVLDGSSFNEAATEADWSAFGEWLPVYPTRMKDEYDLGPAEGGWLYVNAAGEQLRPCNAAGEEPDAAGWFFGEALAPVSFNGRWAYTDRSGNLVTEAVYEPIWHNGGENNPPEYAASLQNGYAAICRDGKWGLLDATGAEVIPCEYPGVAWEGTTLWVKAEDGWHTAELPRTGTE